MLLNLLLYKLANSPLVGMGYGYGWLPQPLFRPWYSPVMVFRSWGISVMSLAGSHILMNIRSIGLNDNTTHDAMNPPSGRYPASNTPRRLESGTDWRTYFTTVIGIDDQHLGGSDTVELKTVGEGLETTMT